MQNRRQFGFTLTLIGAVSTTLCTAACAPSAQSIAPTVRAQQQAINAIQTAYNDDIALRDAMLETLLDTQRTLLEGRLHRQLIIRDYLHNDVHPDHEALQRDLDSADPPSELAKEVHSGRMTPDEAHAWLDDYAQADASTRRNLLAQLEIMQKHTRAEGSILSASRSKNDAITLLFGEVREASNALLGLSEPPHPSPQPPIRASAHEIFDTLVAEHIHDPDKLAAARELIDAIFDLTEQPTSEQAQIGGAQ